MKTYAEVLKDAGLTDDQIKIFTSDARAVAAFEKMQKDAADTLALATQKEKDLRTFWDTKATPQIDEAYTEAANAKAMAEFYRAQNESARAAGFVPQDAPGYKAPEGVRNPDGTFKPNANAVPGSPALDPAKLDKVAGDVQSAFFLAQALSNEYLDLVGAPYITIEQDRNEAVARGLKLRDYAEQKYDFAGKRKAREDAARKKQEDAIRADERAKADKEYAEKYGANPDARLPVASTFSRFRKTEQGGQDRLAWAKGEKREKHAQLREEAVKQEMSLVH